MFLYLGKVKSNEEMTNLVFDRVLDYLFIFREKYFEFYIHGHRLLICMAKSQSIIQQTTKYSRWSCM